MVRRVVITRGLDVVLFVFAFILTNATAFSFTPQFLEPPFNLSYGYAIAYLDALLASLVIALLVMSGELRVRREDVRRHGVLLAFVVYCLLTAAWSIDRESTFLELVPFLFATFMGVYLAKRLGSELGGRRLLAVGLALVALSAILLLVSPPFSRLLNHPYYGAWRGVFWHRNHLGSLMAFFAAVGLYWALRPATTGVSVAARLMLVAGATTMVVGSRSATGILILAILVAGVAAGMAWLRYHERISRTQYRLMLALAAALAVFLLINRGGVLRLVGRDSTLTGRTAIWSDLLGRVWPERPVLGHGYGALWNQTSFRLELQELHGWPYPVFFSDNGYLDLLLNLGVIGLVLFLVFFLITGYRTVKHLGQERTPGSFFPLMIWTYVGLANLSYSFLLEVDQFVWMLLVMAAVWSAQAAASHATERRQDAARSD